MIALILKCTRVCFLIFEWSFFFVKSLLERTANMYNYMKVLNSFQVPNPFIIIIIVVFFITRNAFNLPLLFFLSVRWVAFNLDYNFKIIIISCGIKTTKDVPFISSPWWKKILFFTNKVPGSFYEYWATFN